ncbi:hypothetical protein [Xanthomonas axonopodis]
MHCRGIGAAHDTRRCSDLEKQQKRSAFFDGYGAAVRTLAVRRAANVVRLLDVDARRGDGELKKNCKRVLTVKKA